ncbi:MULTISPECIES: metal/formaldehyde-sensitive transcriptional repressor [unclassified Novosphingobium]|jgi:DNA-binding FrmR family transcriptional regulator|uniref:metal/formaldehyde-sensitive transcriptional repressor n=1 Tax=unclassified Novosphingobium TaxID=2644732 RepID=UPI0025E5B6B9|nr:MULTISPECIES: metal/formaldehyde-sensitive transcriptional repressor [unclassified Novosphingobium]HQV04532.1 metal/formaldehyde-sensitive transcriptional repressor [Novosphingobium sp.]
MAHIKANKDPLLARVRRIAGQVGAIEKAIVRDADCGTVLHQVAGVRGALGGLLDELVADHVRQHLASPGLTDEERTQAAEDLIAAIRRYAK